MKNEMPSKKIHNEKTKNLIAKVCCALFAIALLAGCQSADSKDSKVNVPTRVTLLFSLPKQPYYIIGRVAVNRPHQDPRLGYDSSQIWQEKLQTQAAAAGADAVIVDMMSLNNINSVLITGTSIRYKRESAPPSQ
jgi:hypothetical protein